ncbi:LysR family transcriptional regulator [Roseobacter sp. YSTF-M11]|uniref:LysR family transcriptional regulator n=1 Tax=Roseobacter insulae TaxID=2859783 RepID=A0A9X1G191_9RHOB|nr:LysR family transcriptional regulator [Roseobacter insulae]MBW4710830.1 LysR family transcriptional regulator [Roseobacter insulae]
MELRQLECFVAVAEELHFRKAGERLGLSSSALSDRINALETELGATLFFRTTRQVSLTQAGAELLRDANKILSDIDKSVASVRHTSESDLKTLRISGVDEAISMLLPQALAKFRLRYPSVHTQILEISSSDFHAQQLESYHTDIAFIRTPSPEGFVTSQLLYRQNVVVVTSKTHPLAEKTSLSAVDLLDQPIVGYPKRARPILHEMLWHRFRDVGRQPNIVCEVIDKSTLLQFVLHGLGIALAPAWVQAIAPRGLSFVPFDQSDDDIELYVAYRTTGNSELVAEFIDIVTEAANQGSK